MECTRQHASMLAEVGLDFKDLIGKGVEDGQLTDEQSAGLNGRERTTPTTFFNQRYPA